MTADPSRKNIRKRHKQQVIEVESNDADERKGDEISGKKRRHFRIFVFVSTLLILASLLLFVHNISKEPHNTIISQPKLKRADNEDSRPEERRHDSVIAVPQRRFPVFGSKEFIKQCPWAVVRQTQTTNDCTFLLRPQPSGNEGITEWVSKAASAYISAQQTGCRLLMDYGNQVDLSQILIPVINWTIPPGFSCSNHCTRQIAIHKTSDADVRTIEKQLGITIVVRVPFYRYAYLPHQRYNQSMVEELKQHLDGFDVKTGMACSLGSLFQLSPRISQFEPQLFTRILPTLRDEKSLVIAIYQRTGHTDQVATAEKSGQVAKERFDAYKESIRPTISCALQLEEMYLSSSTNKGEFPFTRIIWTMVSDGAQLKEWVAQTYGGSQNDANARIAAEKQRWKNRVIPREVVTTSSKGRHTRLARKPSTADFADAFIDWYLIGESDLVITNTLMFSFGAAGSLRTALPLYLASSCSKLQKFWNV